MRVLVFVEHDGRRIRRASESAIGFARSIAEATGGSVACLVVGHQVGEIAEQASALAPTLVIDHQHLANPLADRFAGVLERIVTEQRIDLLAAASTTASKDILGRAAGLLGGAMAGDVVGHEFRDGTLLFRRPMFAGSILATVQLEGRPLIVTVRPNAYAPAEPLAAKDPPTCLAEDGLPDEQSTLWIGLETRPSSRPDLTEARIVVSGGRAFKSAADFERLVGGLADTLGAAVGSTRALVDSGITPNDMQVGQTGKVVAPALYFALGISGAIQHLAGMKNARVVVAINSDPDAPVFQVSDYGIVGDVYELVPELIQRLRENQG